MPTDAEYEAMIRLYDDWDKLRTLWDRSYAVGGFGYRLRPTVGDFTMG
jgi:hypothetical protein